MAFRAPSYARYAGPRLHRPAWVPLMAITLRRGWRSKWVKRLILLSVAAAVGMMMFFYVLNRLLPEWRSMTEEVGRQVAGDAGEFRVDARLYLAFLYVFVYPVLLPLSLLFGTDLVASDLRTNAVESYFSRPITPFGYLLGRTLAYTGFLLAATLLPLLLVWYTDVSTAPAEHMDVVGHVPLGFAQALILVAVAVALLVQAAATVTRSAMGANIFLIVFFIFFQVLGQSLFESTDNENYLALAFLNDVAAVCAASLGVSRAAGDGAFAPTGLAFAVVVGVALVSAAILMHKLRRRALIG